MTAAEARNPGIYLDIPNDEYHASEGVSKSGLWTIHTQSPAHYKYPPVKDTITAQAQAIKDVGTATHTAILEPDKLEATVYRGPDDRRGNKWKDAEEFCAMEGKLLLVAKDYDAVLTIRDSVHADAWINGIITGGKPMIEASGYWVDEETGVLCRCRPDFYREDLGIIIDLKTTKNAKADPFARDVINYGYHAQEAHYSDGFQALGKEVNGFIFLALEKVSPYARALYELPPSIVMEGREIIRQAKQTYRNCWSSGVWPAYPNHVQELAFKRWHYSATEAPEGDE